MQNNLNEDVTNIRGTVNSTECDCSYDASGVCMKCHFELRRKPDFIVEGVNNFKILGWMSDRQMICAEMSYANGKHFFGEPNIFTLRDFWDGLQTGSITLPSKNA